MSQKSEYENISHYIHLITEPFESMMPILAIKPSHFLRYSSDMIEASWFGLTFTAKASMR